MHIHELDGLISQCRSGPAFARARRHLRVQLSERGPTFSYESSRLARNSPGSNAP